MSASITPLPTAPGPADSTSVFNTRAFAWVAALATFTTEANTLASEAETDAATAETSAATATTKRDEASTFATNAANSAASAASYAGAQLWVSGTTYTIGQVVYSPADRALYRRVTAGAGTTDPSADATNWSAVLTGKLTARSLYFATL